MRHDMQKLICERQRGRSSERSQKTRKKLNPYLDYESGDYDWGPTYVSSARHRQEGRCSGLDTGGHHIMHKRLNENLRPLFQFLDKSVGRPWNDVYSEICSVVDSRRTIGYHVLQHVGWHVDVNNVYRRRWFGDQLYVDSNGILRKRIGARYVRPVAPVKSLHWYGNVWFVKETLKRPAKCGCVHFKARLERPADYPRWRSFDPGPDVCIHGNEPQHEDIWYVIEYGYHDPDEVYKAYYYETALEWDRTRYGLKEPGDSHIIYYRDRPELLKEPFVVRKKVANRKELKLIRKALEGDSQGRP